MVFTKEKISFKQAVGRSRNYEVFALYAELRTRGLSPVAALTASYLQLATDITERAPIDSLAYVFKSPFVSISLLSTAREAYRNRFNR